MWIRAQVLDRAGGPTSWLVADVGGTQARLACLDAAGRPARVHRFATAELAGPVEAIERFCELEGLAPAGLRAAALAVAAPVSGDEIALTNAAWRFSRRAVKQRLGLERLVVLNDFEALAWALPHLDRGELETLRGGVAARGEPLALIGPGTGLGVAAWIPSAGGGVALRSEGGHRDLAAANEREWRVSERLAARFGHVSLERALCGPGLVNLHAALRELAGQTPTPSEPAEVTARARDGTCPHAVEACQLFSGWLGAAAGDLTLTLGARGGLYLGGGLLLAMGDAFDRRRFRARFAAKGRLRPYLRTIPIYLVSDPAAPLLGAAAALATSLADAPGKR